MAFDNLDKAIKTLINNGTYSLFNVEHETIKYILWVPGGNDCCRKTGEHDKYYNVDEAGNILGKIDDPRGPSITLVDCIHQV